MIPAAHSPCTDAKEMAVLGATSFFELSAAGGLPLTTRLRALGIGETLQLAQAEKEPE
jgi:hypothetical protein